MSFSSLNNLLDKTLKRAGIYEQVVSSIVLDRFSEIVNEVMGEERARRVKGMYIKNKTLYAACLHPILAQELKMRERDILEKVNGGKEKKFIESIRYIL